MHIKDNSNPYISVPGRGLMSSRAHELRLEFFKKLVQNHDSITNSKLSLNDVQNNIESFIGSYEIPVGLAGPLLYNAQNGEKPEWVYTGIGTSEGALLASMNRGAKAISESGGFNARFVRQKMLRAPVFGFVNLHEAYTFQEWIATSFERIKELTSNYSNFAKLTEIKPIVVGKFAHLKFIYTTGDASGQNMVTHCTWEACLWIETHFEEETGVNIQDYFLEGNGASDKKVSYSSMQSGRGVHVVSECFLTDEVIEKTLRTTSEDLYKMYTHSRAVTRFDGMIGDNVNVANTIAGIFAVTGQDLACIHESSVGVLQIDKVEGGIYFSISLPCLVIGTYGGGTHLPAARTMLELMDCYGANKLPRFAEIIAGFTLSLEVSTLSALASGQFARAHQKLGKNRIVNRLVKSEITVAFVDKFIQLPEEDRLERLELLDFDNSANGILSNLAKRVSRKVIGFIPLRLYTSSGKAWQVLLKSKPLDDELIKGLHLSASTVSSEMADLLLKHRNTLEYHNAHLKEMDVYAALKQIEYPYMPDYYGGLKMAEREIFLFLFEDITSEPLRLFNSEDQPEQWTDEHIQQVIKAIDIVHRKFLSEQLPEELRYIPPFAPQDALPFYSKLNAVNRKDFKHWNRDDVFEKIDKTILSWKHNPPQKKAKLTLTHNDFNPRNIAIRQNGQACIYDWELAMLNIPQRDVFEFLAFTLLPYFDSKRLQKFLKQHWVFMQVTNGNSYTFSDYLHDFEIAGYEFMITRLSFYLSGNNLAEYSFIERVFKTTNSLIAQTKQSHVNL